MCAKSSVTRWPNKHPFGLSLSEPIHQSPQPFDKLRGNGKGKQSCLTKYH